MVGGCRSRLGRDEVLLCCLHVGVRLCQPELGGHRALVSRLHQLLDPASLTCGVRLPHVSEDFADVGRGTSRVGGRLPRFGIRFSSVGGDSARVGYHLAQVGFGAARIRYELAHIGARGSLVRGRLARVGIRVASIGNRHARVGRCVSTRGIAFVRAAFKPTLLAAGRFSSVGVHQRSMGPPARQSGEARSAVSSTLPIPTAVSDR